MELGICIGIIIGEGSFTHYYGSGYKYPRITVGQRNDPAALEYLRAHLGGAIYKAGGSHLTWDLHGRANLNRAVALLLEHMPPCHKRQQMLAWLELWTPYLNGEKGSK